MVMINNSLKLKKIKNVAAYARVSMDCDNLSRSFSNQVSYYNNFIKSNPSWRFVKIYSDYGISGTKTNKRAGFTEMIEDAKAGKIDIIITKSISRFARNTVDLINTIRELKEINVEVRFEKENINSLTADGELMLTLLASFAQEEVRSISENEKWGRRKMYERGIDQYRALFGFDYDGENYTINKKEGAVVKDIFTKFNAGMTYTEIAKTINCKTRNNKVFNSLTVKDILRQDKYMGNSRCLKKYVVDPITSYTKRNRGELPQYLIEGTHPAIVTKEEFDKAQERIKYITENKVKCNRQSSWHTELIRCPVCGSNFIKSRDNVLACGGHRKKRICKNYETIKIDELENILKDYDINKIDHIFYIKTRFKKSKVKNILRKEDLKIIWKEEK